MRPKSVLKIEKEILKIPVGTEFTVRELGTKFNPRHRDSPNNFQIAQYLIRSKYAKYSNEYSEDGNKWIRVNPEDVRV